MKNSEKTSKGHSSSKDSEKGYEKESLFNFKNHKVEKTSFSHTYIYIYQRQQKKSNVIMKKKKKEGENKSIVLRIPAIWKNSSSENTSSLLWDKFLLNSKGRMTEMREWQL